MVLPKRNSQNESAFSRGNATSGAPICSGMIRLPNAKNSGVANISSMSVPCIVNSWLYCSGDRNCSPGRASSARISMAIRPPMMKNDERGRQVHQADRLVIGRPQQVRQPGALARDVRRARPADDRLRRDRGHAALPAAAERLPRPVAIPTSGAMSGPRSSRRCARPPIPCRPCRERPPHRGPSRPGGKPGTSRSGAWGSARPAGGEPGGHVDRDAVRRASDRAPATRRPGAGRRRASAGSAGRSRAGTATRGAPAGPRKVRSTSLPSA